MLVKMKVIAVAIAIATMSTGALAADYVYQTNNNPWGSLNNDNGMTAAFGSGNWSKSGYNVSGFTGTKFVFLDGSDSNAVSFSSFLASNQSFLEGYVADGGHLFINSAPNQGGSFSMGFGGTQLNYGNNSNVVNVTAAGVAAGLTEGTATTQYSGNSFAHGYVTGSFTSLVDGQSGSVFGGKTWGKGYVAFGSQTVTQFHQPSADSQTLFKNQLQYVASVSPVPEPETYAMLLAGLGLMGGIARRRKQKLANA